MKTKLSSLLVLAALLASVRQGFGQTAQFFRVAGPNAVDITALQPDGTLVWSNAQPGATYTIQTANSLPAGTNWTDYVQIAVSNAVNTNLIVDFNPSADMRFIPGGRFTMGDNLDGYPDSVPTLVTVSAFHMDMNLVIYAQWQLVYNWAVTNGYGFSNAGMGKGQDHPVFMVDWYDTLKWCNARSQLGGLTPVYCTDSAFLHPLMNFEPGNFYVNWSANGFRLPTEAEWEKAARGGVPGQRFPFGNTINESQANYFGDPLGYAYDFGPPAFDPAFEVDPTPYTSPESNFAPNNYGLFDMAGNLQEWCWDYYTSSGYAGGTDPHGSTLGTYRVFRGGFWGGYPNLATCYHRNYGVFSYNANQNIGFRCVKMP